MATPPPTTTGNAVLFRALDYPANDLARFRKEFVKTYRRYLRSSSSLIIEGHEDLTPGQTAIIVAVEIAYAKEARRGEASFRQTVKAHFRSHPCCFKRHFLGCMRAMIGFAEKKAADDFERFIWIKKWKQATKGASKRAIKVSSVSSFLATETEAECFFIAITLLRRLPRPGTSFNFDLLRLGVRVKHPAPKT